MFFAQCLNDLSFLQTPRLRFLKSEFVALEHSFNILDLNSWDHQDLKSFFAEVNQSQALQPLSLSRSASFDF